MEIKEINVSDIEVVENIRQRPLQEDLRELMESIKQVGLMQPIGVKKEKDKFTLIWGFRRLTAYTKLGYKTIPAVIFGGSEKEMTEQELLLANAIENIQRKQVGMVELGRICFMLRDTMSVGEISSRLSIPITRVKNALDEFKKVPKKYRDKIVLFENKDIKNKRGLLGSTVANAVLTMRGLTQKDREMVFEWVRKEEKTIVEVNVLGVLIKEGMNIKQAIKECNKYTTASFKLAVNLDKYNALIENIGKTKFTKFVKDTLNDKIDGLVF